MLFPYNVDVGMRRWPWANWGLMAATAAIGAPCWLDVEGYYMGGEQRFLYLGHDEDFAWYQTIGYLFGHAGIVHLLGNMWALFLYGNAVNAKIGHVAYLALYFAVGALSGLTWLWFGDGDVTLGASGAVMGMMGAFVALYPRNNVSIFYWFLFKMGTWEISAYFVIAFYVVLDFVGVLGGGGAVNHLAHFSGALFGFGAIMGAAAFGLVRADAGEQTMLDVFRGRKAVSYDDYRTRESPDRPHARDAAARPQGAARPQQPAPRPPVRRPPADDAPIPLVEPEPRAQPKPAHLPARPPTNRPPPRA